METTYQAPRIQSELPGPKAQEVLERDGRYVSPSYTRDYPLVASQGRGCWIEDVDGNVFLDVAAGIATCATGHCHPAVVAGIREQAGQLIHMSGADFYYPVQAELAELLAHNLPWDGKAQIFFGNSGAEANECALKLARWHTERQLVISFEGAFHGRTYGALSLTASKPVHKDRFFPLVPGVYHVPYGDADAIERLLGKVIPRNELAAIFVESIQGESGYRPAPEGFLERLKEICEFTGALLVCDEVQAGMGRTGKMWGFDHYGVKPDIVTSAKGIASGMPLGVCASRPGVMNWVPGAHASTFGGNPVACRAAVETIGLLKGGLIDNASSTGAVLKKGLEDLATTAPEIQDVRGYGLMLAAELPSAEQRDKLIQECFRRGLLILGCGPRSVRFSPALVISEEEAKLCLGLFSEALSACR